MKKNKKTAKVFLLVVFLLMQLSLQAKFLSENEVKTAVETWVRHVTADARPDAHIEKMEPHLVGGEIVAYIAHLSGEGFCLCGTDDLVLPVYLYSPSGIYDKDNPVCRAILWEIEARLKNLKMGLAKNDPKLDQYKRIINDRANYWQQLAVGTIPARELENNHREEPNSLELSLTCTWGQGSPYNDQCPLHVTAGQRVVVGCVATAMSQIMYYWKWPNSGVGNGNVDYEYRWRNNWDNEPLAVDPNIPAGWGGRLDWGWLGDDWYLSMNGNWDGSVLGSAQNISANPNYQNALQNLYNNLNNVNTNFAANFGATNYQWNLMQDVHADPPDAGSDAAATISYHAGVAVDMDYGLWASSSHTSVAADAYEDHFRYDTDTRYDATNINMMTEEILWLRPFQIGGSSATGGGHSWVIYGYDKATDPNREFRMNFGWNGNNDGWYVCDQIDYNADGNIDFNLSQGHTTHISPIDVVQFVGDTNPGDGTPNDPYENIEEAVAEAPDNSTLIFKAGSNNTFSAASLEIDKPLVLKGHNAVIQKE